jgi:hypothetical protein
MTSGMERGREGVLTPEKAKPPTGGGLESGPDETRTRNFQRDRLAL